MARAQVRYAVNVIDPFSSELVAVQNAVATVVRNDGTMAEPIMWDSPTGGSRVHNPLVSDVHGQILAWLDSTEPPLVALTVTSNSAMAYRAGQPGRVLSFDTWTGTWLAIDTNPSSVGSGTLSARPASALDGQIYPGTDTGLLYAWIAAVPEWMTIGAVTPTNLVTAVVPATGPAAVTLSADSTYYGVPELTTADCTWPAGLVRVSANDLAFTAAALNKLDVQLAYSLNGGTTWTGLVGTRVTVTDALAFFARGRQLKPVVSATNVSALTPGVTVRFRVQVARVAGQTLATANIMQGASFGFPSITVEQVR